MNPENNQNITPPNSDNQDLNQGAPQIQGPVAEQYTSQQQMSPQASPAPTVVSGANNTGMMPQDIAGKDKKPVLSLISGIVGVLTASILIGALLGLVAIILGFLSFKNGKAKKAIAGIILGILAILLTPLLWWFIHDSTPAKIVNTTIQNDQAAHVGTTTTAGHTVTTACYTIKNIPGIYTYQDTCQGSMEVGNDILIYISPDDRSSSLSDMLTNQPTGITYTSKTPISIDNIAAIQAVSKGTLMIGTTAYSSPSLDDFVYNGNTYSSLGSNEGIDGFDIKFGPNKAVPTLQEEQTASSQLISNWQWK